METLLKPSQARKILVCSTAEVYRLLRENIIPSVRRGNRWYIAEADLVSYIESKKTETKAVGA